MFSPAPGPVMLIVSSPAPVLPVSFAALHVPSSSMKALTLSVPDSKFSLRRSLGRLNHGASLPTRRT
ncbi:hypothetical protein EMCG_01753 [[Emmonsia] crescens]|uniref:Uncharacterized protein n=1 Tax=[Emmonsia] crescens TaxID=73230 RepID=A0A0G2I043_9EURO|nr:hypothetical protein EMCG_01753 [Emmonsia crescens UAMH 3008]